MDLQRRSSQKGWVTGHRLDAVQASRVGKGRVGDRGSATELFRFRACYFRLEGVG